jgi:hypothetical protein
MWEYTSEQDPLATLEAMARIGSSASGCGGIGVNSSFSWMAAYLARRIWQSLNSTREAPVFFLPRRWFNCIEYARYKDIFPSWATIIAQ